MSVERAEIGLATRGAETAIYALCEHDGTPRYVGKTVNYIIDRLRAHLRAARRGSRLPVHRWLARREREERGIVLRLLEYVPRSGDWVARERHWIAEYRAQQYPLLNLTAGGEGLSGHRFTPVHRAKIAAALRTGAYFSCEVCCARFWRNRRDIQVGHVRFCSRRCYAQSLKGVTRPMPLGYTERGVAAAAAARRALTHCKRGHLLSGVNLFITSSGSRGCRACRKIHKAAYRGKSNG